MTMKSAAAWADLLRLCTALRRVYFGGAAVAEFSKAAWCDVTCAGRVVVCMQATPWATTKWRYWQMRHGPTAS